MRELKVLINLMTLVFILSGCGDFISGDSANRKKFYSVNARLVGLPVGSQGRVRIKNLNFRMTQSTSECINAKIGIDNASGQNYFEFDEKFIGCRIELSEFSLDGFQGTEKFSLTESSDYLQLLAGERRTYTAGGIGRIEVLVESGIENPSGDVIEIGLLLKPLYTPPILYHDAEQIDFDDSAVGFLTITGIKFVGQSTDKRINSFMFEFVCPEQMRGSFCQGEDVLDQRFILLSQRELNLGKDEIQSVAQDRSRHVIPKRTNFLNGKLQMNLGTETGRNENLAIISVNSDSFRMYQVKLP